MKGTISQCSESGNPELTTEKSTSLNEIDNTKNPVNKNSNNDNWLEESISSSFSRNAVECEINAEENLYGGDCYDDQEIDCYDDGGFNCDIGDYFNVDTSDEFDTDVRQTGTETEQKEADNIALHTENASNSARHDQVNVEKRGRECKTVGNKRRQTKPQKSMTPMLDYSNMATPDLTTELKQYGVRPLAKRKMIIKLKEIYHYTHQDSSSDSEMEDKNDEKQAAAEGEQLNNGEWEKPRTCSKNSEDCSSAQDSGESSESGSCSVGDELSEDILSQESSLNLSKRIMDLLTQNRQLYLAILKYQPISLLSVQEILKDNGVKCSAEKLKDFLDEQCITFSEPRPAQARRKQRRAKPKSRKKN